MERKHMSAPPLKTCQEHIVADGGIERSVKVNGIVERSRRCDKCASLFKTFEMTDDKLAFERAEHEKRVMDMGKEISFYRKLAEVAKMVFRVVEKIKDDLEGEWKTGNGYGD